MRRALFHSLPLACLLAAPALAADATPERAASAEAALRDFMTGMLGPSVRVGDKPIHMAPNGDHYDASATLAPGEQMTATVREAGNGVWTFENLRYPNPAHFTVDMPGKAPNSPDTRVTYDLKAAEQDQSGTVDTTLATPSTTKSSMRAFDAVTTDGTGSTSTSHIGRSNSMSTFKAGSASGTMDVQTTYSASDYSVVANAKLPTGEALDIRVDAGGLEATANMDALGREQAPRFVRAVLAAIAAGNAAQKAGGDTPPIDKAAFRELFQSMSGLATGMSTDQTLTKLQGVISGFSFSMDRFRFGFDGHAPDGKMALGMELETDALTLPAFASNPFSTFFPSKFEIHPVVTGIDTHDLLVAMDAATDPSRPDDAGPPPEFMALFASPALAAEITSMEVDVGPSVIAGTGKVNAPQPGQVVGAGKITATQFDALTDRVKAVPEAAQALPVLLFAKGIARTEGDHLVWDISYDGNKALVNGVDVLALAAGGAQTPAPAPKPTPAPAPAPNNRRNGTAPNTNRR